MSGFTRVRLFAQIPSDCPGIRQRRVGRSPSYRK